MNMLEAYEAREMKRLSEQRGVPDFAPGDTVKVGVRVVEGTRERVQIFEGVVIARSNKGLGSNFTVRKISNGEGVERVFPLYSPSISEIEVVRRGKVRRAKLYYLRDRSGKSARIQERARTAKEIEEAAQAAEETKKAARAAVAEAQAKKAEPKAEAPAEEAPKAEAEAPAAE